MIMIDVVNLRRNTNYSVVRPRRDHDLRITFERLLIGQLFKNDSSAMTHLHPTQFIRGV